MADISDVEQTIAGSITAIVYPQGSSQGSIAGVTCRIYRGWPNSATLNSDLGSGVVNITITSDNDCGKTTTRYLQEWQYELVAPTLTASISGQSITVAGSANVGVVIGALINGYAFVYRIIAGDTPELVAANLCAVIQGSMVATVSGNDITVPGATSIIVRTVNDSTGSYEGRRQEKDVRIAFWCSAPAIRDSLAAAVDLALSQDAFVLLPDNSSARMQYKASSTFDQSQNALLYRRDLLYCVEYPTIITVDLPTMLFGAAAINGQITYG